MKHGAQLLNPLCIQARKSFCNSVPIGRVQPFRLRSHPPGFEENPIELILEVELFFL